MKTYIGIDNGTTGSIAVLGDCTCDFYITPVLTQQNYTKTKQSITRLNVKVFTGMLEPYSRNPNVIAVLERPMVNPGRFKQSLGAVRCLEAMITCLENLRIPYMYIDSKEWQKALLPIGKNADTKKLSVDVASRLFPQFEGDISKHKDGDALLIAEYSRRVNF